MADNSVRGRFLWTDLITTDPPGAIAFYPKVVGWKTQAWEQDTNYTMWVADSGPIGGLGKLPESQRAAGAKSHWIAYIGTDDMQATIDQATSLGGLVVVHATEIPNGGRYAMLADPQGGLFGIYSSPKATAPALPPKRGEISWHELATSDYAKAFEFYQQLFGWEKIAEHDMGPMGIYLIFGLGNQQFGGIFNSPGDASAAWLNYVSVNDVGVAAKAARAGGGEVRNGPMEVPGGSWIAQLTDPQGASFAVHAAQKPSAAGESQAKVPAKAPTKAAPAKPATKSAKPAVKAKKAPAKAKASKKAAKKAVRKAAKKKRPAPKKKVTRKKTVKRTAKKTAKKAVRRAASKKKSSRGKRPARKATRRR